MRYLWIFLLGSLTFTEPTLSQNYGKVKVGIGLGPVLFNNGIGGGSVIFEPAFRTSDEVALGLRFEFGQIVGSADGHPFGSYTVNGQYYFSENTFRPFIGLGFGTFRFEDSEDATRFGYYPRIGFDAGHFTLLLDYNVLTGGDVHVSASSYFQLRIGFFIGGGKSE